MDELVAHSVKHNVSDLHLCEVNGSCWRRNGVLEPLPVAFPPLVPWLNQWLSEIQQNQLSNEGQVDFALTLQSGQRLRANAYQREGGVALALRLLAQRCPSLAGLGVPEAFAGRLSQRGLILVTGATGSGKSTTLCAAVGQILAQGGRHVVTLEDPIEFIHAAGNGLIEQREIGRHCRSFSAGLRAALRQDPDVIVIGELRDEQTIRLALTAAETGHLVLATLHTRGACQAVERLVDNFSEGEKKPVRSQLAGSLLAVLAQRLERGIETRVALFELLVNTPAVANLIREGKDHQLPGILQTGQQFGMQDFAASRAQCVAEKQIEATTVIKHYDQ